MITVPELRSTEGFSVPLREVSVSADVAGGTTRVRIRQRYEHDGPRAIEAVYTFPLPSRATLSGVSMQCAGRTLDAVVKPRDEAFREYDDAVTAGHGAALVEQERPDVFTANIGNVLPGEVTVIELEYVQPLRGDDGALRWVLPTLVAPRYVPGAPQGDRTAHGMSAPTDRVPDADRISPPTGNPDYTLALTVNLTLGRGVTVESPSHAITVDSHTSADDGTTRVTLAESSVLLDRDVVLLVRGADREALTTFAAHRVEGEREGSFVLTVVPDLFEPGKRASAQTVVFLIDTSGSMDGASLPEAKRALRLCLRQLREGDRFDVIEFNSSHRAFASAPVPFTQATLTQADAWVEALRAHGGTELLGPLVEGVKLTPDGVVVLLTDGQVGNEDEIFRAVMAARVTTRVYSFGIGTNVSDALLARMARETGGAVEGVYPGERVDEKVVAQFGRMIAPRVRDVRVKFDGIDASETAPGELPALVDGEPWQFAGRYVTPGRGTVHVRGVRDGSGETFAITVPVDLPAHGGDALATTLWATMRLRDFEAAELTGDARRAAAMKERIVALATRHRIASRHTAFVLVETRTGDRVAHGMPETRVVPVSAPAGWAMGHGASGGGRAGGGPGGAVTFGAVGAMPMRAMGVVPMARARRLEGAASSPPSAMARPAPAPAAMAPQAPRGGMMQALKKMVGGATKGDDGAPRAELMDGHDYEVTRERAKEINARDAIGQLFTTQLASGLWSRKGVGDVEATADVLARLVHEGIDDTHALYGAQVRKAVEALIAAVASVEPSLTERAMGLAMLVTASARGGRSVRAAITSAPALSALAARIGDRQGLKRAYANG